MIGAFFIYTIAAFGFVYIVGHSLITKGIREWIYGDEWSPIARTRRLFVSLLECPACLGFWIGLVAGYAAPLASLPPLTLALYTTGANFILAKLTGLMPEN